MFEVTSPVFVNNAVMADILDSYVYIWGYAPDPDTRPYVPERGRTLGVPGVAYYRPEINEVSESCHERIAEFVESLPYGAAIVIPTMEGETRKGEDRWVCTREGWVCNPE